MFPETKMNKKGAGFMDALQGLGIGIIGLAIVIGVGVVVLNKFADTQGSCISGFTYEGNGTADVCANTTDSTETQTPLGAGFTVTTYLGGELGSTGLAGWVPAIIALVIGLLFLGAFVSKGRGSDI